MNAPIATETPNGGCLKRLVGPFHRVTLFREEIHPPMESVAAGWRTQDVTVSFVVEEPNGTPRAFRRTMTLAIPPGKPDILHREQCPEIFEREIERLIEDVIASYRPNGPDQRPGATT
jgi:hypothetical protein